MDLFNFHRGDREKWRHRRTIGGAVTDFFYLRSSARCPACGEPLSDHSRLERRGCLDTPIGGGSLWMPDILHRVDGKEDPRL